VTETGKHLTLLLLLCAIFFLGNGTLAITDQVESNYVLTAKEMLSSGDYFSPRIYGEYWYDKPAFFYWELIAAEEEVEAFESEVKSFQKKLRPERPLRAKFVDYVLELAAR